MLRNHRSHLKTYLKCLKCIAVEIQAHIACSKCGVTHDAQHWPKTDREFYAKHKSRGAQLTCMSCRPKHSAVEKGCLLQCASCQAWLQWAYWTRQERDNHKNRGTLLVCRQCRAQGCQPQDPRTYRCKTCLKQLGPLKFERHRIHKHNRQTAGGWKCRKYGVPRIRKSK